MSSFHTVTKRSVTEYRRLAGDRLFVADLHAANEEEHELELMATNSYWLVPAYRVAPLLEHYNLDATVPHNYDVNGAVTPREGDPPNVAGIMPDLERLHPVVRLEVAGKPAYIRNPGGDRRGKPLYLALFAADDPGRPAGPTDGAITAVNVDYLDFIVDGRDGIVYRQESPLKPLCVYVQTVIRGAGDGGEDVLEQDLAGIVMPVRL